MAIKLMLREYRVWMDDYKHEYICDTDADLANLPECTGTGSTAVSLESGKVMVVNTQGEWVVFGEPSGGGSELIGTWEFNDTLTELEPNVDYLIAGEMEYGDDKVISTFGSIRRDKPSYYDLLNVIFIKGGMSTLYNYDSGEWSEYASKKITITGGDDINNETFITWLKENATKVG